MDQVTFEMRTSQHDSYLTNYVLCSHFLSKDYLICYAKSPRILLHTFLLWPPGCNRISLAVIRRNLRSLELRCKPNEDAKREEILPWIYWTASQALLYFSWNIPIKIVHCYSVTHRTFSRIIFLFWKIKKLYRCPKFDSYAMQTLEIRVEQKRNRWWITNGDLYV